MTQTKKEKNTKKSNILLQPITEEMQSSYLDYAMSVIVSRALPDVRDGLKPVHRRILYAMWQLGLKAGGRFRKSAIVVGEVLGKYHPHGDAAVYASMVRLAQNFSMRYPFLNGQGNFGSIDGDGAAAMRYTETKLKHIAEEMMRGLKQNTVDFKDNYDGSQQEPCVMPSKIPSLLLNGTLGIAVGMATKIPPHNLSELCDAITYLIKNPEAGVEKLITLVKGPDFPGGGFIFDKQEIKRYYATGKGSIVIRGKTQIVEGAKGFEIVITEIPYQVNKAGLIEKAAKLVKSERIKGIKRIVDESDRNGMRITIRLKKNSFPKKILNQLYKYTRLQTTFHVNMVALIDGIQPRLLSLKRILSEYIKHRQLVITRRTKFELQIAQAREHILIGLIIALENIDKIILTIKKSKDKKTAKANLIKAFKLTPKQTDAILQMQLQALAGLERLKVEKELQAKKDLIKKLESILKNPEEVLAIIQKDLKEIKKKYGDKRRTQIFPKPVDELSQKDLIPKEDTIIMITKDGYIKRLPPEAFKSQGRGGKGVIGLTKKEEDSVGHLISANTHNNLLFFTDSGKVFQLKAFEVPELSRTAKGQSVANFLALNSKENVTAVLGLSDDNNSDYLIMTTQNGISKKIPLNAFKKVRRSGLIAITLKTGDSLKWVKLANKKDQVILVTSKGLAIRFSEKQLRPTGRSAQGVIGIKLGKEDTVISMNVIKSNKTDAKLLVITENGYGKMTELKKYKTQSRAGKGLKTMNVNQKTGNLTVARIIYLSNVAEKKIKGEVMLMSKKGQVIKIKLTTVPTQGRVTQGARLMRLKNTNDKIVQIAIV